MFCQSYSSQGRGLPLADNEKTLLKRVDILISIKATSKVFTLASLVLVSVSPIFGYDPAVPLLIAVVSGITWWWTSQSLKTYEECAQMVIQFGRRRDPSDPITMILHLPPSARKVLRKALVLERLKSQNLES